MDEIDQAMIACLRYDGRMLFTVIADQVGVSEATVTLVAVSAGRGDPDRPGPGGVGANPVGHPAGPGLSLKNVRQNAAGICPNLL